jgi:hypothetical protein
MNDSARFDDGIVRFSRAGDENVSVTIAARQDFTLPLIWQMFNLDLLPHLKHPLVSDAYLTYFGRTMANYEAAFAGRDVRTGRDFFEAYGEPDGPTPQYFTEAIFKKIIAAAPIVEIMKPLIEKGPAALTEINPMTKEAGSMVTSVVSALSGVINELFDSVRKDLRAPLAPDEKVSS